MDSIQSLILILESINNPNTYLSLMLFVTGYSLWKVVWFTLNTMNGVIEANTSSHTALMSIIDALKESMKENTEAVYRNKEIIDKCHIKNESSKK